jgi:hypothetical protein
VIAFQTAAGLGKVLEDIMRKLAILWFVLFVAAVAFAQIPGATPFSADSNMKMKDSKDVNGKVYFSGSKMRQEMNMEGHEVIQILNLQSKIAEVLMPQQKMYMEMNYGQLAAQHRGKLPDLKSYDPNNPCAQAQETTCEKVGPETVNGRSTEKWIFKNKKDGSTMTAWLDKKLFYPIRMQSKDMEMNLTNIMEGMPSASLFEVPAGYRKLDIGSMMRGQTPQPDSQ